MKPSSPPGALVRAGELLDAVARAGARGLELDATLVAGLRPHAARVHQCPGPQLYERLTQALCSRHPDRALQAMHDLGVLAQLLPELEATVDFSQEAGRRHKDVWDHTKIVVWQSVPHPAVRWAAALHDIGKVPTRRFLPGGSVTFHGHAELGQRMFEHGPARRIAFPTSVRSRVGELIRLHQRPGHYEPSWTDSAVRRFRQDAGEALDDLLNLSRADITSKRPGKRKRCLREISVLAKRIRTLDAVDSRPKPLPSGLGRALMTTLELPPGRHLASLRDALEALCLDGELEGGREAAYYVEAVRRRELLAGLEISVLGRRPRRRGSR